MRQFTLYRNENRGSKATYPYFVDVQNDLLDTLNTRVVIPLTPHKYLDDSNISNLCPNVDFDGEHFVLMTHQMTSVSVSTLKTTAGSLEHFRNEIVSAIDFLVTGI